MTNYDMALAKNDTQSFENGLSTQKVFSLKMLIDFNNRTICLIINTMSCVFASQKKTLLEGFGYCKTQVIDYM